jgi:hypothetical protein
MTTYPAIIPSSRNFTPGQYPHTPFQALSGKQGQVRHSSVMISSTVQLRYSVLDEPEMIEILDHYNAVKGGLIPFALPTIVWSGNENVNDFTLPGDAWRYASPPEVEEIFCGGYVVQVALESVPGEGVGLLGADFIIGVTLIPGVAAAASGKTFIIGVSLEIGVGRAPGATETIDVTLTPGTATGGIAVIGPPVVAEVRVSLIPGLAFAGLSRVFTINTSLVPGGAYSSSDPDFDKVEFLLHGWDGYVDSSANQLAVTTGAAITTTTDARFGGEAILFSQVANSWMEVPEVSITGDCTIDAWFKLTVQPTDTSVGTPFQVLLGGSYGTRVEFGTSSGNIFVNMRYQQGGFASLAAGGGAILLNKYHHLRITHTAGVNRIFIDGALLASTSFNASTFNFRFDLIGVNDKAETLARGYYSGPLQGLRITSASRSTAAFALPTQSWPDTTNRLQGGVAGAERTITVTLTPGAASSP